MRSLIDLIQRPDESCFEINDTVVGNRNILPTGFHQARIIIRSLLRCLEFFDSTSRKYGDGLDIFHRSPSHTMLSVSLSIIAWDHRFD